LSGEDEAGEKDGGVGELVIAIGSDQAGKRIHGLDRSQADIGVPGISDPEILRVYTIK